MKTCEDCNGSGIDMDYKSLYLFRRRENHNKTKFVKCKHCRGTGKLDWLQVITKPIFKTVDIKPPEAFDHLKFIFKNVDHVDEWDDEIPLFESFEEVMNEYMRMYYIYVEDGVIHESIPGCCPDILGHHFSTFNEYIHIDEEVE